MKSISGLNDTLRVGMDYRKKNPAKATAAKLLSRTYYTNGNGNAVSIIVPFGATYCVARAVGAGGAVTNPTTATAAAGGGSYAKATFAVSYGQTLSVQVGDTGNTGGLQNSIVKTGAVVLVQGDAGGNSNGATSGAGATTGVGDLIVPGSAPTTSTDSGQTVTIGGKGGSDAGALDAVMFPAFGTALRADWYMTKSATAGGGGVVVYNSGFAGYVVQPGADGLVVLEFWTGDPRQTT